ncbi:ankyrin repeat family protein [Artemisia annua]|uniref:Ankyrin repeat family protein n=1 Tax=Artemisia annua TaxID=35608 RepID=A0A2U1QCL0_ARTAN|nr:ankyrin repeat family protein [Artemisia annua]
MTSEDLLLQNRSANTAFSLAAAGGNVIIAKILVQKTPQLVNISGNQGILPLYVASLYGKYEMVKYLYGVSDKMGGECWNQTNRGWVLQKCMEADFFDVALKMVKDNPEISLNHDVLHILAQKTDSFEAKKAVLIKRVIKKTYLYYRLPASPFLSWLVSVSVAIIAKIWHLEEETQAMKLLKIVWSNIVQCPKPRVDGIIRGTPGTASQIGTRPKYSSHVLFIAAEMGNTKLMVELIDS